MNIMLLFFFLFLAFVVALLIRNEMVYNYRTKIAEIVFSAGVWDWQWREAAMDAVNYDDMMLRFWKPLDTFYSDKSFLDLSDVRGIAPWESK